MASDTKYFDEWYADMERSRTRDQIASAALGLPPGFDSNSLITWDAVAEVTEALDLTPGDLLVDLACGRGAYGLEVARRTQARLIGVDFSAVALEAASRTADRLGATDTEFRVGDLVATGLSDSSANAIMCIDAMQFADTYVAGLRECRRVLVPGGRLVVTGWEAAEPGDERVPERTRRVHMARDLAAAGFEDVDVVPRPDWREAERSYWEAVMAADADGDPAVISLQREATHVLAEFDWARRLFATATAPRRANRP